MTEEEHLDETIKRLEKERERLLSLINSQSRLVPVPETANTGAYNDLPSRATMDFPEHIQALLKRPVRLWGSSLGFKKQLEAEEEEETKKEKEDLEKIFKEVEEEIYDLTGGLPNNCRISQVPNDLVIEESTGSSHSSIESTTSTNDGNTNVQSTSNAVSNVQNIQTVRTPEPTPIQPTDTNPLSLSVPNVPTHLMQWKKDEGRPDTTLYRSVPDRIVPLIHQSQPMRIGTPTRGSTPGGDYPLSQGQLNAVLVACKNSVCRAGWRCWNTVSCGGAFIEDSNGVTKFEHREPIVKNDTDIGQFAICVSFLRKCIPSPNSCSCDTFLKSLDIYISSGFARHPCSNDMFSKSGEDDEARKYLVSVDSGGASTDIFSKSPKGSGIAEKRDSIRLQRIPRGILIAAGVYLRVARMDELLWRDEKGIEHSVLGPSVLFYLEPPKAEHALSFVPSPSVTRERSASRSLPTSPRDFEGSRDVASSPPPKLEKSSSSNPFMRKLAAFMGDKGKTSKGI